MRKSENAQPRKKGILGNTLLLALMALVAFMAVTYAWFSISDNTRLSSMRMDVTTGLSLRIDLSAHEDFEDYKSVLSFAEISARILAERGIDISAVPIEPVTTHDVQTFTFENGSLASADSGHYLDFTLHFMAQSDMYVHLTSSPSRGADNGTRVWSNAHPTLPDAMRIAFTSAERTFVYDPGENNIAGLTDGNTLFFLPEKTDVPVRVHIWMEGTDPACNNELRGTDYSIQLRFEGSDENNQPLS